MFQGIKKLFGGKKEEGQILAPVAGQAVPLSDTAISTVISQCEMWTDNMTA